MHVGSHLGFKLDVMATFWSWDCYPCDLQLSLTCNCTLDTYVTEKMALGLGEGIYKAINHLAFEYLDKMGVRTRIQNFL